MRHGHHAAVLADNGIGVEHLVADGLQDAIAKVAAQAAAGPLVEVR